MGQRELCPTNCPTRRRDELRGKTGRSAVCARALPSISAPARGSAGDSRMNRGLLSGWGLEHLSMRTFPHSLGERGVSENCPTLCPTIRKKTSPPGADHQDSRGRRSLFDHFSTISARASRKTWAVRTWRQPDLCGLPLDTFRERTREFVRRTISNNCASS